MIERSEGGRPVGARQLRIGLACAGGVVEGAFYEIGVLHALERAIAGLDLTRLDVYVGISAGAMVTSALANGITPERMRHAFIRGDDPAIAMRPEVVFMPAVGEYARRALKLPGTTVRALVRHMMNAADISLAGALSELATVLPTGVFDNAPLERHLARVFSMEGRTNSFTELPARLRVLAVDVDSSKLVAFGEPGWDHVPISRAVQASTALPLLYCPVEIDGRWYIDGVARRTLNASLALAAGVDLLFCVNPIVPIDLERIRASGRREMRSLVDRGLWAVASQTFRTVIHSRMRTGFKNYEYMYPGANLVLIEPEMDEDRMFFSNIFSFSNRARIWELGYASACAQLLRDADRLEPLLRSFGLRLRRRFLEEGACVDAAERRREARGAGHFSAGSAHATLGRLEAALGRLDRSTGAQDAIAVPAGARRRAGAAAGVASPGDVARGVVR